jgi:hypothetical protein
MTMKIDYDEAVIQLNEYESEDYPIDLLFRVSVLLDAEEMAHETGGTIEILDHNGHCIDMVA